MTTPRAKYLVEMARLSDQFNELREGLRPVAGETDTMIVPLSLIRRLLGFVEQGLGELRDIARYVPEEVLEGTLRTGTTASAAIDETFHLLESHAAAERRYRDAGEAVDELRKLTWEIARNVPATTDGVIATLKYLGRVGPDDASRTITIG
jgi:hypothetical protein